MAASRKVLAAFILGPIALTVALWLCGQHLCYPRHESLSHCTFFTK